MSALVRGSPDIRIVIITNFVVVLSVGIKRVDCVFQSFIYVYPFEFKSITRWISSIFYCADFAHMGHFVLNYTFCILLKYLLL